jgi:hypothetical protein
LAAVTDRRGQMTCVHRTWLDLAHRTKAPLADPRRAIAAPRSDTASRIESRISWQHHD